ncbi:MAG: hypothetical protein GY773_21875, partial [Actinomycetia bacterium]|nr:hypothetical protein [Actinomycetes bacterium]
MSTIRVDRQFEGPPGTGQGGWTAWCFADKLDGPVTIALRAPIPLDTDLQIAEHDDRWSLFHERDGDRTTVLEAERWVPHFTDTEPVSVTEAGLAR